MTEEPKPEDGKGDGETKIEMTQDEINKMIEDRLAKARRKWESEQAEKDKKAREAEELEKLQGEEKLKKLHQSEIEKISTERDKLSKELKIANAKALLSSKGLNADFASMVIGSTDEETAENIERLGKSINDQVTAMTQEALHKGAPPAPGGNNTDAMKEAIFKGFGISTKE